jgi:hypothetical protein
VFFNLFSSFLSTFWPFKRRKRVKLRRETMDILPPPEGTSIPPIDVPFVAKNVYDPATEFSRFPWTVWLCQRWQD